MHHLRNRGEISGAHEQGHRRGPQREDPFYRTHARQFPFFVSLVVVALPLLAVARATPTVEALLYNPTVDALVQKYPYNKPAETVSLKPKLSLVGSGFPNGGFTLDYRIEAAGKTVARGSIDGKVMFGLFEVGAELKEKYPQAEGVAWELAAPGKESIKGYAPLSWSRFHGQVKYRDGLWNSTSINLVPTGWGAPSVMDVPVADDGTFDALVPSRVYMVVRVDGTGYQYNSMERWAWDFDLTRDRKEEFIIGRMELYGMRAFGIKGGGRKLLVLFRPTTLTRLLKFDANQDGVLSDSEKDALGPAMKLSPTAIGPELKAEQVKVWVDGKPLPVLQFNQIPEVSSDGAWQVLYLLQVIPESSVYTSIRHEVRLEVESQEELRGKRIVDFGEGSVGFDLNR